MLFEEEDLKGYQWQVDEQIPEEADEASSVGGDEITPRRLEEDQEELARINEELTSARQGIKKTFMETQPIIPKKKLQISHISSVNNSRDETHFMSPTSAGNISIPLLPLSKVKRGEDIK